MGKIIVITGAGGGLGSIFAAELSKDGYEIAILDFDKDAAEKTAKNICRQGGKAVALLCDVTDRVSMERAREELHKSLGICDILINCAGIQDPLAKTSAESYEAGDEQIPPESRASLSASKKHKRTLFNLEANRLAKVMNVNWLGTVISCQIFAADMVGREGCSIINITSMAAYDALSTVPAYASSKAAVDMFTKWLSNYLSNTYGKVRVNAVAPGYFLTAINHDMYVNPDGSYTNRYYNVIHRTPMGRLGNPKELVGALRFFADPDMSGYITGQVIAVDGGFLSCPGI